MRTFTQLNFGTNGGMGAECQLLLKNLAEKLLRKDGEPYPIVITWLRARLSFEILRSVHMSVRGSRLPFRYAYDFLGDFCLNVNAAEVFN